MRVLIVCAILSAHGLRLTFVSFCCFQSFSIMSRKFYLHQYYLLLTKKCNLSCSHCIRSSDSSFSEFISLDLVQKIFEQLSPHSSQSLLLLSGGEPTLHPKFNKIVEMAYEIFPRIMINTNGLNLHKLSKISHLNDKISIQVSLDGNQYIHELIRGRHTYLKTLANIHELSNIGFDVVIASTISNKNSIYLDELDKDLNSISFKWWNIKRIVGYGRANDIDDIDTNSWNELVFRIINNFENKSRIRISPMFLLSSFVNPKIEEYNQLELAQKGVNCGTGRSKFYINPNGTVYPCACMESQVIADFNTDSFEFVKKQLQDIVIKPNTTSICYKCNLWNLCQGGCPGISQRFRNNGDPRCPINNRLSQIKIMEI